MPRNEVYSGFAVSNQSIFNGVLHRETAFTALLANLLRRSKEFQAAIYEFLTSERLPNVPIEVIDESRSEESIRPDITLKFADESVDLTLEVKVRSSCKPTRSQRQGKGSYSGAHWLVPRDWLARHPIEVPKERIHTLEQLAEYLRSREALDGEILSEFISYLELVFPTIQFTTEERGIMMQDPKNFAGAAIKLHRIVESVAERLCEPLPEVQAYELKPERTHEDYGYYIKKKGERNGYILWFGIWPWADCLLGSGFEAKWHPGLKPAGFAPTEDNSWMISNMNDLVDASDPVQSMYRQVLDATESLSRAS
jgi:hypothetical protein